MFLLLYTVVNISEPTRQSDWDNILACHRGLRLVTAWSYQRSTMGQHKFDHERFNKDEAQYMHTVAQVQNLGKSSISVTAF